jgi:primosomal protein N'
MQLLAVEIFGGPGKLLSYSVPEEFAHKISVGSLVAVTLRGSGRLGIVVHFGGGTFCGNVKAIDGIIGDGPAISAPSMELARWTAANYGNPLWKVLEFMVEKRMCRIAKTRRGKVTAKRKGAAKNADRTGFLWPQDG